MINKVIKHLIVMISILVLLSSSIVGADSRKASEDEIKLAKTVEQFFTDWLIKRDVEATMKYVSPSAILCNKSLPSELRAKKDLSKKEILSLFQTFFSNLLQGTKKGKDLPNLISSSYDFVAITDSVISVEHSERKLFELFVLNITQEKTAQDFGFICKFDETPAFREAVGKPTCYYVMTDLNLSPDVIAETKSIDKFPFEMVWVKEGGEWRMLTFGVIED